jgi:hypothetical protein
MAKFNDGTLSTGKSSSGTIKNPEESEEIFQGRISGKNVLNRPYPTLSPKVCSFRILSYGQLTRLVGDEFGLRLNSMAPGNTFVIWLPKVKPLGKFATRTKPQCLQSQLQHDPNRSPEQLPPKDQ